MSEDAGMKPILDHLFWESNILLPGSLVLWVQINWKWVMELSGPNLAVDSKLILPFLSHCEATWLESACSHFCGYGIMNITDSFVVKSLLVVA
jgi:hypothetical protein